MNLNSILRYLVITMILSSCNSRLVIESRNTNFVIIKPDDKKIEPVYSSIYSNAPPFILFQRNNGNNYDASFIKKQFSLKNGNDTMNILCFCGAGNNYYFKNLKFTEGTYIINVQKTSPEIFGVNVKAPKTIRTILFKNYFIIHPEGGDNSMRDAQFKDLKFKVIDFSTKYHKMEKITIEEFWDNNYYSN